MLNGYFNLSPKVEMVGSYYVISGISVQNFSIDLKNNFGTTVIFNRLITRLNARSFKIHKFFMVELAWILDHLTSQKNKRTVDRYYVGMHKYKQLFDEVKTKTWLETTFQTFPSYPVDEALKEFNIKPFEDQRAFLEDYSKIKYGFQLKGCLLDAVVGSGKAQPLSSLIRVPGGWKRMGDIRIGDSLFAWDGEITFVKSIHSQGVKNNFELEFVDGRKGEACDEHLWDSEVDGEWGVRTTRELNIHLSSGKDVYIPLNKPLAGKDGDIAQEIFNKYKDSVIPETDLIMFRDAVRTLGGVATIYDNRVVYDFPIDGKIKLISVRLKSSEEMQCISIDHKDQLYITNDYIVTHNTPTSLIWSKMISKGKLFVIVPKGLVFSPWVAEIKKVFKNPPKVWTSLDGTELLNHTDAEIFIIHKEPIRSESWELVIKTVTKNGQLPAKVIVDECHNYNEHSSQQTKGLIDFCSHPYISDVLFMSGTPIKAQGKETYALFTIIDKFFDKQVRDNFLKMYGRDNTFLNEMLAHRLGRIKYTIPAITTMDAPPEPEVIKVSFPGAEAFTLNNIRTDMLAYITDRVKFYKERMPIYKEDWRDYVEDFKERRWSDESSQIKVKQYIDIVNYFQANGYNNFTDADKSKFCAMVEKEIESYLKGEDLHYFRHIKSAVKYVGLKIRGEALGNVLGKARMLAIKETIRHANLPKLIDSVKKKTLVYTSYVEVINELETYFKEVGLKSVSVYGNNSTEIDKVIAQLAEDPETNPLITTFQTLREGKPMLMANQIILMNSPFRSYELTQTIARIHRRGQDEQCYVYLIDLDTGDEENITSRSIDIMEWSREQVEALLGGGKIPGVAELGVNTKAIGGMEEREYIWDVPQLDPLLDIPLDVVEAVPSISNLKTSITDIF